MIVDCGPTADYEVDAAVVDDPPVYVTVTENVHQEVWPSLDCALTLTDVVPTGNALPEAGFPVIEIGATPPSVVAV